MGKTVRLIVASESHPLIAVNESVSEPESYKIRLFQLYGSWLSQIETYEVLWLDVLTERLSVAKESQPLTVSKLSVWEPALLKVRLFHVKGSWFSQIAISVELKDAEVIVRLSVASESQPFAVTKVSVCDPALLNVRLFHEYGSARGQTEISVELNAADKTERFSVAKESQPFVPISVSVWDPPVLKVRLFHK